MTNKGDLISREALKEDLAKEIKTNDMGLWLKILLVIDNAPTVDLSAKWAEAHSTGYDVGYTKGLEDARPKGEWKRRTMNEYLCSNCRYNVNSIESLFYKFCPKCGSDMRGANNG